MNDERLNRVIFKTAESALKTLNFISTLDCADEVLIAELFVLGATTPTATISSGSDRGAPAGQNISIDLDVTEVALGDYTLKIYTTATGVIAKAHCLLR